MKYLLIMITMLCMSATVFARPPSRSPAIEGGGATEVIEMPVIEIEGTLRGGDGGSKKAGCGGDCTDGKADTPPTPVPTAKPAVAPAKDKSVEDRQIAEKELLDAAMDWKLDDGDKPLESTGDIIKWGIDKILGPISEILDALESEPIGLSESDRALNKGKIKGLRAKLELEEKELKKQKEENQKAYEENTKLLFPSAPTQTEITRDPASINKQVRFENAIKAIAKLRSEDFYVIAEQVIRRSKADAPIRLPIETSKQVADVLMSVTPANACAVKNNSSCVLLGIAQGAQCYCPKFRPDGSWIGVTGVAVRKPVGRYCRSEDVSEDLHNTFPVGIGCRIPVDLTIDPYNPQFSFIYGHVSKEKCESWGDKTFKPECQDTAPPVLPPPVKPPIPIGYPSGYTSLP